MRLINQVIDFLKNKWILQPFLISLFTVFYGIKDIGLQIIVWYEVLIVIVILIIYWGGVFFFSKKMLEDDVSSSYVTTLFVFLTLFFAGIQQTLHFIPWLRQRHVLILVSLIFLIILFVVFNKKRRQHAPNKQILLYSNILFILLNIQVLYEIIYNSVSYRTNHTIPLSYTGLPNVTQKIEDSTLPDIYIIILDGYANQKNLKKYWRFDNSPFIQQLSEIGFYYAPNSKSNYAFTLQTLASMLNLDYLSSNEVKNNDVLLLRLKQNKIVTRLKNNGYKIYNFSVADIDEKTNIYDDYSFKSISSLYSIIFSKTLYSNLNKYFFYNTSYQIKRELEILQKMNSVISSTDRTPKFVIYHSMITHFPYYLDNRGVRNKKIEEKQPSSINSWLKDEKGYRTTGSSLNDSIWMKSYLNHVLYTNNISNRLVKKIIKHNNTAPIIVLMSDHGFRFILNKPLKESKEEMYSNFFAVYFPDKNYKNMNDSITPINVMRLVLNKALSTPIILISDKSGL